MQLNKRVNWEEEGLEGLGNFEDEGGLWTKRLAWVVRFYI